MLRALGMLAAAAGLLNMARRPRSVHRLPQPGQDTQRRGRAAADDQETRRHRPDRTEEVERQAQDRAAQQKRDEREERHRRREVRYWRVTSIAAVLATVGTLAAASFAAGAYLAALDQARIARDALVASTRARLKITDMEGAAAIRSVDATVAWFNFKAAYTNFGQSPAQRLVFIPEVFVAGSGVSAKEICDRYRAEMRVFSSEIVFPQDKGGGGWISTQMPLRKLEASAAKARAPDASGPVYLSVVGCLIYRSTADGAAVHVTGLVGDLHPADEAISYGENYVSVYNIFTNASGPVEIGLRIRTMDAWAD